MNKIQLCRGGTLKTKFWSRNKRNYEEEIIEKQDIDFYLNDEMCIEPGTTLKDVFLLINNDVGLFKIITCCPFLIEYLQEALSSPVRNPERHELAALRLEWIAYIDDGVFGFHTDLHGVGEKGKCSIALAPLNEICMYPLILDTSFVVRDLEKNEVVFVSQKDYTLSEFVRGIIDSIAVLGPPEVREFADKDLFDNTTKEELQKKLRAELEESDQAIIPCKMCGKDSRSPAFGKPEDICEKCFNIIKEN